MSKNHSNYLVTELRRFCSTEDPLITTMPSAHSLNQCDAGNFLLKTIAKYLNGWRAPLKVIHRRRRSVLLVVCRTLRMDGEVPRNPPRSAGNESFPFSLVRGRRIRSREFARELVRGRLAGQQGRAEHSRWAHQGICSAVLHQVQVLELECCSAGATAHGSNMNSLPLAAPWVASTPLLSSSQYSEF